VRGAVEILTELASIYDNRCFITHRRFRKTGFTLHHLWYIEGDVRRDSYAKTPAGRDEYYRDLEPLVRAQPYRFILITNGMHTRLDHYKRGLTRLRRENQYRLILAMLMTRKR